LGLSSIKVVSKSEECIFLDVEIQISQGKRVLRALLDSEAQGNFISQAIVLEEGVALQKSVTRVSGVGGHLVTVHG